MPHRFPAPADSWTAAVHLDAVGDRLLGTGVVIDDRRVLTSAHVLHREEGWREEVWVAFPKAGVPYQERRIAQCRRIGGRQALDVALLELAEPVPTAVVPARLRLVPPAQLCHDHWWVFGFPPAHRVVGNEARGRIGAPLAWGHVRLDSEAGSPLAPGFSGGGIWSPAYRAVVGLVVRAAPGGVNQGDGHALTLHRVAEELPHLRLHELGRWSAEAADDDALTAWGWRLRRGPRAGRQWSPRGRGERAGHEPGHRFQGRRAALTTVVSWLTRPQADHRVLVITGSPGAGKSAVLGRVVATADPRLRTLLPPDDEAVRAAVGSVSCAVHAAGRTAAEVAAEIARAAAVAIPAAAAELLPGLRAQLAERSQRFTLVVDALDEMVSPQQARQLVRTVLLPLAALGTGTAAGVQVVVGTRRADSGGELLSAFGGRTVMVDLDDPAYFEEADLVAHAATTLRYGGRPGPGHPYADAATAAPVARRIAALAGGNFLVAGLVARAHAGHDTEPVEPEKISFTPTVDAALEAYLADLTPVGDTPARLALTVLAYAESPGLPLPLWQAGVAALHDPATAPTPAAEEQLAAFARRSAANFLVETDSGPQVRAYRLFHQALAEALLRARETSERSAADERRLVGAWLRVGTGVGWSTTYDYLLRHLPAHAERAGLVDELLSDDGYLLHADLRRLSRVADRAETPPGRARARLLQRTPLALPAGPAERAAMFSVTEQLDRLGSGFRAGPGAWYRARWARTRGRTERTALEGHAAGVLAVCPVPQPGRPLLASGGADGTVRVWEPTSGQPERVLTGHTGRVRHLCTVDVEGRTLLASASDDHTVRLWDPTTGSPERVLTGHTDWVRHLCTVDVEGRTLLASASDDHTVRLWDAKSGATERIIAGHRGWVSTVATIPVAGRPLLATAGPEDPVQLWDPGTGARVRALTTGPEGVTVLTAVTIGERNLLAGAGYHPAVVLWDPATGLPERSLAVPAAPVTGLGTVLLGGRQLLAATTEDRRVRLWDPATGAPERVLTGHTDRVHAACAVPRGGRQLLASAGDDATVRLWDPATGQPQQVLDGTGPVTGLAQIAVAGVDTLAATGRDGVVRLWALATGAPQQRLSGHRAAVTDLCPVEVAGQRVLASASEDGTIMLWDPAAGRARMVLSDGPAAAAVTGLCAVPLPSGDRLASTGDDDRVRLWHPGTGRVEQVLHHLWRVTAVCAVPTEESHLLASADEDGVVRLWEPGTGQRLRELRGHHAAVTALCPVPVGGRHLLVSAGEDHAVHVWDPESGNRTRTLTGHTGRVTDVCPVPTAAGRHLLASTSEDRTLRLWDPATGAARLSIPVYHPALACLATAGTLLLGLEAGLLVLDLDHGPFGLDRAPA